MFSLKKIFLIFLIFILFFLFLRFYGEDIILDHDNCKTPMLWLHAVSSHERLKSASEKKYCGVEIDITLSNDQKLIASYDDPEDLNATKLDDLISINKKIKYWWIDLKNLNFSNAHKISLILNELSLKHKEKLFFIESHDFFGLWRFKAINENIYKVYWLAKGPYKNSDFHSSMPLYYLRSVLANILINPDFISMFHYQLSNSEFLWVGKRQIFTFTVNNLMEYQSVSNKGISVILTDKLSPSILELN